MSQPSQAPPLWGPASLMVSGCLLFAVQAGQTDAESGRIRLGLAAGGALLCGVAIAWRRCCVRRATSCSGTCSGCGAGPCSSGPHTNNSAFNLTARARRSEGGRIGGNAEGLEGENGCDGTGPKEVRGSGSEAFAWNATTSAGSRGDQGGAGGKAVSSSGCFSGQLCAVGRRGETHRPDTRH